MIDSNGLNFDQHTGIQPESATDFQHPDVILTDQSRAAGTEDYDNDFDGSAYVEERPIPKPVIQVDIKRSPQPRPMPRYNTLAMTLVPGADPVPLVSRDPKRQQFRINTPVLRSVQIGDRSQVTANNGYIPCEGDVIANGDEFFIACAPGIAVATVVTVLVEYNL